MSISEQISALQTDKTNIRNAILNKGGTCASGNGFDDFETDIFTINNGEYDITVTDNGDGTMNLAINDLWKVFDMRRNVDTIPQGVSLFETSSLWKQSKVYTNVAWQTGVGNSLSATLSNITKNSVTSAGPSESIGALYSIKVNGGKTYKLIYDYSGVGKTRVNYSYNVDGTTLLNQVIQTDGTAGLSGTNITTITIPSGTNCWLFLTFASNTNSTKSFANVFLKEV